MRDSLFCVLGKFVVLETGKKLVYLSLPIRYLTINSLKYFLLIIVLKCFRCFFYLKVENCLMNLSSNYMKLVNNLIFHLLLCEALT
jgi:predicted CDP-diglyceride synthetase/phosphatidate cytidylyltransferase